MDDKPTDQEIQLYQRQRQHNSKVFTEAAIRESVAALGFHETKTILESYVEYLDEFVE